MVPVTDPALLCTSENYIRSSWFADTYRAETADGEQMRTVDIQHISLPFDPVKETAFKSRYGLDDGQMRSFYRQFAAGIQNSWKISDEIKVMEHPGIDSCILPVLGLTVLKKADGEGSDIYTVFEASDTPRSAGIYSSAGAELHSILRFLLRLADTAERFSACGICTGYPDPDMLAAQGENWGRILFLNLINFSYAEHISCPYAGIVLPFDGTPGEIRDRNLRYACALIWTMLDGRMPGYFPDFTRPPSRAPAGVAKALAGVMSEGAKSLRGLRSAVSAALEGTDDCYISFVSDTGIISYEPQTHPGDALVRMRAVREEAEDDEYYGRKKRSSKRRRAVLLGVGLAAAVAAAALIPKAPDAQTAPECGRPYMSREDGIFALGGAAVDGEGELLPELMLDAEGSLRSVLDGVLLFDRDHVSEYTAINGISCEVLLKDSSALQGAAAYTVEVRTVPADACGKSLLLESDMPLSINHGDEGMSHVLYLCPDGRAVFTAESGSGGVRSVRIGSPAGGCSTLLELDFPGAAPESPAPSPSTEPDVQGPAPAAASPVMYGDFLTEVMPEPESVPAVSEPPEFALSTYALSLCPGESASVATSGDDGGIIFVYSTDESVAHAGISGNADGCYTVSAVSSGRCEIVFSSAGINRKVEVAVN